MGVVYPDRQARMPQLAGMGMTSAVDAFQRRHRVVGFPLAVLYKYFDDQGAYLAAVLTYYAFIAIFPLMLIATSVLGFVLQDDPRHRSGCSTPRSGSSRSSAPSSAARRA